MFLAHLHVSSRICIRRKQIPTRVGDGRTRDIVVSWIIIRSNKKTPKVNKFQSAAVASKFFFYFELFYIVVETRAFDIDININILTVSFFLIIDGWFECCATGRDGPLILPSCCGETSRARTLLVIKSNRIRCDNMNAWKSGTSDKMWF